MEAIFWSATGARLIAKDWIWRSIVAGLAGSSVHALFMSLKAWSGLLPSFQPYQSFQIALGHWIGAEVPAFVPWALTFLNGSTILGFLFGAPIGCCRARPAPPRG